MLTVILLVRLRLCVPDVFIPTLRGRGGEDNYSRTTIHKHHKYLVVKTATK